MQLKNRKLLLGSLVLLALAGFLAVRKELMLVPRVRVGALHTKKPGKASMRFFALGDTGTGGEHQMRVAQAMNARCKQLNGGIDGILLLGDNAYPIGFSSVSDSQWQTKVVEPYAGDCLGNATIYPVLGNHDYKQNPSSQIEYSLINQRWHMPNRFYSVSFGHLLRVVALDSNVTEFCFNPAFCGLDFMQANLQQKDTVWTVVTAHHPIAGSSDHGFAYRGGVRGMLLKPYLCSRIDAYLSGHSHHLEYRQPEDCRMGMFISGGGGGDLYQTVDADAAEVKFVKGTHGFLDIELNDQEMVARFIDEDGKELFIATKKPSGQYAPQ